jgi:hypothetical protein
MIMHEVLGKKQGAMDDRSVVVPRFGQSPADIGFPPYTGNRDIHLSLGFNHERRIYPEKIRPCECRDWYPYFLPFVRVSLL